MSSVDQNGSIEKAYLLLPSAPCSGNVKVAVKVTDCGGDTLLFWNVGQEWGRRCGVILGCKVWLQHIQQVVQKWSAIRILLRWADQGRWMRCFSDLWYYSLFARVSPISMVPPLLSWVFMVFWCPPVVLIYRQTWSSWTSWKLCLAHCARAIGQGYSVKGVLRKRTILVRD